ncbi:Na+/H+ antiporter subunit E [Pseudonocardia sp.]|jgi:multisubunit Na+/H+ antiporter MnhE subunit|uniref:Na+/H+ antiporter subunit E n=1 Tax=Pseudonocardia sp. TaxID=60912 RepID=UPI0025F0F91C|nr:Na+/H+ antiporter subunit E [Pseudonocardia sp.]
MREGLVWFAVLAGFYFTLVSEYDWPEIATGLGAAAVGATAAVGSATAERGRYRPAWRWVGWLGPLPWQVVGDTARLTVLLARHVVGRGAVEGGVRELRLARGEDAARGSARRALGGWVLSFAPGSYVVDVDPDTGVVVLHDLGAAASSPLDDRVAG